MSHNYSLGGRFVSKEVYEKARGINQVKEVVKEVVEVKSSAIEKVVSALTNRKSK